MNKHSINISYKEYYNIEELNPIHQLLIQKAKEATNDAYAIYSNFKVGAAILLQNEKIVTGNNQENAAYPSGLCAERVALFYANANYPNQLIKCIAISAKNINGFVSEPITPCGGCRQVLIEAELRYDSDITIILIGEKKILEISRAKDLLPFTFHPSQLKSS